MTTRGSRFQTGHPGVRPSADPASGWHEVQMLGTPVPLFLALRQQHNDVTREFAVMALAVPDDDASVPPELRQLARKLGTQQARSATRFDLEIDEALRTNAAFVDLAYHIPAAAIPLADKIESLKVSADRFCAAGKMLTMPRTDEMRRLSAWWLSELTRQVAGQPPTSWSEF